MAYFSQTHTASTGPLARVAGYGATLKSRFAQYRTYRKTLTELQSLSERELADLGLSRAMLRRVAYHSVYA